MIYELSLNLNGAEHVESVLQRLVNLQNQLKSGGGGVGGQKPTGSASSKTIFDQFGRPLESTTRILRSYTDAVRLANRETEKMEASFNKNLNKVLSYSSKHFPAASGNFGTGKLPNIFGVSEGKSWNNAHVKDWAAQQTLRGGLDPSQVSITDFGAKDREKERAARIAQMKKRDKWERSIQSSREKEARDLVTFQKDMSFLMMPMFNPGSMWATLFSARQTFSAMNTMHGKEFRYKNLGGMGAGGSTALLVGGATAAGAALMALKKIVSETINAYQRGSNLYQRAMTGGMGMQFESKRGILASILGVSETEVPRYGSQSAYLMPKISDAAKTLADTAPQLTQVNWEIKVLKTDLSALYARLAQQAAPAIETFIKSLDKLVKFLSSHQEVRAVALAAAFPVLSLLGIGLEKAGKGASGVSGGMPTPSAWMKQLPSSAWEKMGLVTFGAQVDYQKQIAQATRETAVGVGKMVAAIAGRGLGVPVPFGMHPTTNNP
ncbi:MAG: hypothetical protein KGL39_26370 [Patescibacteria group bacterium]|nr:hypothetical protein [Patescibacteria group bacterium]